MAHSNYCDVYNSFYITLNICHVISNTMSHEINNPLLFHFCIQCDCNMCALCTIVTRHQKPLNTQYMRDMHGQYWGHIAKDMNERS